jgi:UDP-N-acetylmuramate dehydrogenase
MNSSAAKRLLDRLPKVRGELEESAPLDRETWFRAGGPADVLFRPADRDDLIEFIKRKPKDVPVTVIGYGSNLLVRDGGVAGVVVRMGKRMAEIAIDGEDVSAGAGAGDVLVSAAARDAGLAGLEFLSGIPGTIGGALRMNAGAYGREMKDIVVECKALDPDGGLHKLKPDQLEFSYRHCGVPEDWIFTGAVMRGTRDDKAKIAERMAEIRRAREESQPLRTRTGGSTFANPPGHKAWKLIDEAGLRGFKLGGAMVSEKHTNFLINTGNATGADIENLGEEIRRRVKAKSGVTLEWEIRRIGREARA